MIKWVKKGSKFTTLFIISVLSIIAPSLISERDLFDWVFITVFSIMVLGGAQAISVTQKHRNKSLFFAGVTLLLSWLLYSGGINLSPEIAAFAPVPFLAFFIYMVYYLIKTILKSKNVTPDVILGAVSGYIFMGYTGGIYFILINNLYENSFSKPLGNLLAPIYFSFITMTTLGYGDISPLSNAARGGAILITIVGQFYIAVIVALLVSKYLRRMR